MTRETIKNDLNELLTEYFEKVTLPKNSIFVVGCSTSEILGEWKGTDSSLDVGKTVVETVQSFLNPRHLNLAVQGCEHINRALVLERTVAERHGFEIVSVKPAIPANGFELDPRRVFFFIFLIFFSFARLIKYINRYILSTFKYIRA